MYYLIQLFYQLLISTKCFKQSFLFNNAKYMREREREREREFINLIIAVYFVDHLQNLLNYIEITFLGV